MSLIKRFMLLKNGKLICYSSTPIEAQAIVQRDKKAAQAAYVLHDLETGQDTPLDDFVKSISPAPKKSSFNAKSKPKVKKNDVIDEKYSTWLGTQACVVTGRTAQRGAGQYDMHCHHIHGRGRGRNDHMQVPLMGFVHSWGGKSYHSCGRADFIRHWELWGVHDVIEWFEDHAKEFYAIYKGLENAKK